MRRRVFIFVRGILGWPGDSKEWNAKAVPWIFNHTDFFADNFETLVGPIDRVFGQWKRAANLARTIKEYSRLGQEPNIVICAHSNGCDLALKGLALARWPRIEALHLASGACEGDFWRNGLNSALAMGRIGRVCLYRAGRDRMLRLANTLAGRWLGYGTLGLTGPLHVNESVADRVGEIVRRDFGHSTWFMQGNFERTMGHFTRAAKHGDNEWITPAGNRIGQ